MIYKKLLTYFRMIKWEIINSNDKGMLTKIKLVIENESSKSVFGRTNYDDNLIIASAKNLGALIKKMKKLLKDFHQLKAGSIEFEIQYGTII